MGSVDTARFRFINPDGQEESLDDIEELAKGIIAGRISAETILFDVQTGRWAGAGSQDAFWTVYGRGSATSAAGAAPNPSMNAKEKPAGKPWFKVKPVGPWRRYWARQLDFFILAVAGFIALTTAGVKVDDSNQLGLWLFLVAAWIPVESFFIAKSGRTLGKAILGIRVVDANGKPPVLALALKRSAAVWWRGIGIGFPIATAITMLVAHNTVTKQGRTSWDVDTGLDVVRG